MSNSAEALPRVSAIGHASGVGFSVPAREYHQFEESKEALFVEVGGGLEGLYDLPGAEFQTRYAPSHLKSPTKEKTEELARAGTFLESLRDVIAEQIRMSNYDPDFTNLPKHQREVEDRPSEEGVMKKAHLEEAEMIAGMIEGHTTSTLKLSLEVAPSIVPTTSATETFSN
ncbi:uncharacterized protein A4U43_UnF4350 [Asparagus officinalis]|uniref:Uncharacterized protein n=1 Tax=Asparagus officinalis TaxID=4686 RepID=A0A1R3L6V9_ASPOF|nr:uncharacterized protein A4U43_UnF4350 [Asparagus officinalis]